MKYWQLILCVVLGIGIGLALGGRYQFRTAYGGIPMRFDRWTGKAEIITPQTLARPAPPPKRDVFDDIDFEPISPQPTSTPR